MKYRAICFDFDYTLGDSTDSIVAGFQYGFTRLGWPAPDRETVRRTVGYLLEDAYTLLTGDRDPEHRAAFRPMFFLASCSKDNDETGGGNGGGGETGGVTDVTPVTSDLTVNLTTDKACYKPGETVSFTADALPAGAKVRYRTLNKVISEQAVAGSSWTWTAPATDFTGYLADVYRSNT